jgi:hypothetical protein
MKELAGRVLLALVVTGCSSTPPMPKHEFDYDEVGRLKKCFAEAARKSYGSREDGELSEPAATGLRFVFHYSKPVDGAHSEVVDLAFKKVPKRARMGTATEYRYVFQVVIHRTRPGKDPVLKEESARLAAEIEAMMASERGASPSEP